MNGNSINHEHILSEAVSSLSRIETAGEYVLPDYIPDANRLLLTTACPKIENQSIKDNRVDFEGSIRYCVLLESEENKLKSVCFSEPFSGTVDAPGISDECYASIIPQITAVNSRLANQRKISIKSSVCVE